MQQIIICLLLPACALASFAHAETLSLQQALALGLRYNYDLQISRLDVERADAGIMSEEGRFDILAELGLGVSRDERPVASTAIADNLFSTDQASAEAALSKTFTTGLETRLSLIGESGDADLLADQLEPAYRTYLILDFTQPLLKDLGIDINTTSLQIAKTRQQQVALGYLSEAQQLAAEMDCHTLPWCKPMRNIATQSWPAIWRRNFSMATRENLMPAWYLLPKSTKLARLWPVVKRTCF